MDVEEEEEVNYSLVGRPPRTAVLGLVATRDDELENGEVGKDRNNRFNNGGFVIPDLNEGVDLDEMSIDDLAIVHFQEPPVDLALMRTNQWDISIDSCGLRLFGFDLNVPNVDNDVVSRSTCLMLTDGPDEASKGDEVRGSGHVVSSNIDRHQVSFRLGLPPHSRQFEEGSSVVGYGKFEMGSDPFNLMPIIEQLQAKRRRKSKRVRRVGGTAQRGTPSSAQVSTSTRLPTLGKCAERE